MDRTEITSISRSYRIVNSQGIHLRPASKLVQIFAEFPNCEVFVGVGEMRVNAKSIMGILMLEAGCDTELILVTEGEGGEEIHQRVEKLIADKFDEE